MTDRAWRILNWAGPIVIGATIGYWPQWTESLKARGGWWTVGAAAMTIGGQVIYQMYSNRKK